MDVFSILKNSNNNVGVMGQARGISALTPNSCCDNILFNPMNAENACVNFLLHTVLRANFG
jgi:hypothetical protein